ncbi:MAG TPA: DUF6456 domain-containing protein [Beijerinckiaceae bacterium]|jgi:hypothetical protein
MKTRQGHASGGHGIAGEGLSREAARLLRALADPGAYALADPFREGTLILRRARGGGVSLGGGRFPAAAGEELLRRDLAEPVAGRSRPTLRIAPPGAARLKRQQASAGVANLGAEGDLAFRAQHQDLVAARIDLDGRGIEVTLNASESPLDWLRRRKDAAGLPLIDAACHEAGERLRRDLTLAAMLPRVTANWEAAVSDKARGAPGDPASATEAAVAARQRVGRAVEAVGSDLGGVLVDLCGFLKGLTEIERERGWPARSGKVAAKLALARLAEHYGLEREACGPSRSRGVRAWREAAAA